MPQIRKIMARNSMIGSCHKANLTAKNEWLAERVDSAASG